MECLEGLAWRTVYKINAPQTNSLINSHTTQGMLPCSCCCKLRAMPEPLPYLVPHSTEAITILHEDSDLLLVRKPHLLLSIPGRHPLNKDCLITRLQQHYPTASIVHRLDLDTSGIMVIPLNKPTHAHISRQFQERQVRKAYHAIVFGVVAPDEGEVDLPITCDWERRPRQMICHVRGRAALTRFTYWSAGLTAPACC